jgi:hypothetical protein
MTKAMQLTVTQKLRLFLARSGQVVAPWSSVEEVMDRLYSLLYQRRDQAGLWEDLAALLDSIQADARGVLAAPDAEILSQSRVAELVTELRRSMRASVETPAAGAMRRFSLGKNASVLACIALLAAGFSLGCGSSDSGAKGKLDAAPTSHADAKLTADTATSPTPDTAPSGSSDLAPSPTPDTAPSGSTDLAPSPPPDTAPSGSDDVAPSPKLDAKLDAIRPIDVLPSGSKDVAPSPDAGLNDAGDGSATDATDDGSSDSGDALMDLFRDGSPDAIATRLEASVNTPPDGPIDRGMMPAYKGVTFPAV